MEPSVRAVIAVVVVAGTHEEVSRHIRSVAGPHLKNLVVVFGKPDIFATVEVDSLSQLRDLVSTIGRNSGVAGTDTKIAVPQE